jgi:hypothetical protein
MRFERRYNALKDCNNVELSYSLMLYWQFELHYLRWPLSSPGTMCFSGAQGIHLTNESSMDIPYQSIASRSILSKGQEAGTGDTLLGGM